MEAMYLGFLLGARVSSSARFAAPFGKARERIRLLRQLALPPTAKIREANVRALSVLGYLDALDEPPEEEVA